MQLNLFDQADQRAPPAAPPFKKPRKAIVQQCDTRAADATVCLVPRNLSEALVAYGDAVSDHPHRGQIRTSIRIVGRALGSPLDLIPADPERLRPLLASACIARARVKPRSWTTAKSKVLCALRDLGVDMLPGRDLTPLSAAWSQLLCGIEDRGIQIGLTRFLRHLSRRGIEPTDLSEEVFEGYRLELVEKSARDGPARSYAQALRQWNRALAASPDWPQVKMTVPRNARWYSFAWDEFPLTFPQDVERFLAQGSSPDIFAPNARKPVREATTEGRRKAIRNLASALVLSGEATIDQVLSLSVLTEPQNVMAAVNYLVRERSNKQATGRNVYQVGLLRLIARDYLGDEARAKTLSQLLKSAKVAAKDKLQRGMTPKNRELLRQFDIPRNVDVLLAAPNRALHAANRSPTRTYNEAARVMYALQTGILTFVPIRLKNLTGLKLREHLIDTGQGSKRSVRIHLPGAVTKNGQSYEAPLPRHLFPVLDAWLEVYRTRVCNVPASPYLFPNARGELRVQEALSNQLKRFWKRETGLKLNPHLFRHIAAKLYLDRDPTGIEVVRQLLGHKTQATTLAFYAEFQTDPAFRRFEAALLTYGYEVPPERTTRRSKS